MESTALRQTVQKHKGFKFLNIQPFQELLLILCTCDFNNQPGN